MLLISWNVAGWSSTVRAIRESYGSVACFFNRTGADIICLQECKGSWEKLQAKPIEMGADDPPASRRPRKQSSSFPVQGSSISSSGVHGRSAGLAAESMQDWESFWSFSEKVHKGFNGVVTFVRKGLTHACDARPFDKDDLNDEGRVVVTYHSAFVLFNVYVPNARGSARSEYKKYFLNSLLLIMERVRKASKKPLILVGDLNMTYRAEDAAWTLRRLHIGRLLELNEQSEVLTDGAWESTYLYLSKPALCRLTRVVTHLLWSRALEIVNTAGSSSSTQKKVNDNSPSDAVNTDGESKNNLFYNTADTSVVSVDSRIRDEFDKRAPEFQKKLQIEQLKKRCLATSQSNSVKRELSCISSPLKSNAECSLDSASPPVTLEELYELGFSSVFADEIITNPNLNSSQSRELYALLRYCGLPPHDDDSIEFMSKLLHYRAPNTTPLSSLSAAITTTEADSPEEGASAGLSPAMYDTFTIPQAGGPGPAAAVLSSLAYCPCPYTCWDQSRNKRQSNEGTRLDYIIVDAALLEQVVPPTHTTNNLLDASWAPTAGVSEHAAFFSEFSGKGRVEGIRRAMGDGLYPPAALDRSGIPPLGRNALDIPFRELPSTGLFLTPPQFSDHIGVCMLFRPSMVLEPRVDKVLGAARCLYRPPASLWSFITKPVPSRSDPATNVDEGMAKPEKAELNSRLADRGEVGDSPREKRVKVERCNEVTEVINIDSVEGA